VQLPPIFSFRTVQPELAKSAAKRRHFLARRGYTPSVALTARLAPLYEISPIACQTGGSVVPNAQEGTRSKMGKFTFV